jgi:hypothetical protein
VVLVITLRGTSAVKHHRGGPKGRPDKHRGGETCNGTARSGAAPRQSTPEHPRARQSTTEQPRGHTRPSRCRAGVWGVATAGVCEAATALLRWCRSKCWALRDESVKGAIEGRHRALGGRLRFPGGPASTNVRAVEAAARCALGARRPGRRGTWPESYLITSVAVVARRPWRVTSRHGRTTIQRCGSIGTATTLARVSVRQVATATGSWLCHVGPWERPFESRKSTTQAGSSKTQQATNAHRARPPATGPLEGRARTARWEK